MRIARFAVAAVVALALAGAAEAQVACGQFAMLPPDDKPAPRTESWAIPIFEHIKQAVKTQPYRALFLGDSITQRWDLPLWDAKPVWDANMKPREVLNAGVAGDRTEHLLWRLDHGNLDGPPPKLAIVLIGTNDLAHGRPPEVAAEGVRRVLIALRSKLPQTRILLLGLWPRGATPADPLRQAVAAVNNLIRNCADDRAAFYADIGGVLLDKNGTLSTRLAPDLLHFSGDGYKLLAPQLDPLIDRLLALPDER